MCDFPFSDAEWSRVSEAALGVVNATTIEDMVLCESQFQELRVVIKGLVEKYGEHPVLLETEADFTDEPFKRIDLYQRAKKLAKAHDLAIRSICLSLARTFLEECGDAERALGELRDCQNELGAADGSERAEWNALENECRHHLMRGQSR